MADYHPLIARAVAGLEKNTGENRRALYGRARTALLAQLRGVTPPLDESEITRERLALEEAIRRVETEAARQAREARPSAVRRETLRRELPPRRGETIPSEEVSPLAAELQQPARATARARTDSEPPTTPVIAKTETAAESEPGESSHSTAPEPLAEEAPADASQPAPRFTGRQRRSLSDEAMSGYRDVMTDRRASTQTRRPEGLEKLAPPAGLPPAPTIPPPQPTELEPQGGFEQRTPPEELWGPSFDSRSSRAPVDLDRASAHVARPPIPDGEEPEAPAAPLLRPKRSYGRLIKLVLVLVSLGAVGGVAYWQRNAIGKLATTIAFLVKPSQPAREAPTAPPTRPKIADRIEQPSQQSGSLPVAQRVVLYEEDPDDAQGKRFVGTALWRTETKPAASGRPLEIAVRADIEVPERKMTMTWTLRRNTDPSLPASHTIEIMFNLPEDSPVGGVQNVPGVLMKQAEQTRGVALAGLAVKVTPGFFLIGLSSIDADKQRNLQLLKERPWFDIPIVYNNNRRAILAMEKGSPGERAFTEAFTAWKE